MSDKDIFKDLFSKKLENYEASVNPKVWSAISSKIGVVSVGGSAVGISFISKLLIGLSISTVVVGGIVLVVVRIVWWWYKLEVDVVVVVVVHQFV